ncbi:hypothetical protein ACFO0S_11430 [Chryseomicrobium palamuruense]|uniref:Uncharacterized protein n=1 Tax=Chryseomicrobium palamuruense TaxID=682973 RepID=A0ABV8UYZ6_9BACL
MQKSYVFQMLGYLLTALTLFSLVPLIFPFLGEAIQTISAEAYLFLYVDMTIFYWVLLSLLCALPAWYVLSNLIGMKTKPGYVLGAQFLICSVLITIYYFNRHYLDELWISSLYE